jgi:hypothetical protein
MMAKKAKKKAKLVVSTTHLKDAGAIVAEVVVHFGAGYAMQRGTEGTAMINTDPIFGKHADFVTFQRWLLGCTSRNLARHSLSVVAWRRQNSPTRAQVTLTAFAHGMLARKTVVAEGTGTLTNAQVMATLQAIKATCPAGGGGGDICQDN